MSAHSVKKSPPVLVSVIVPAYNAESWIKDSINSILEQTWESLELIIVNDGSTDGTEAIMQQFSEERIKYYKQENKGQAAACNLGLSKATGDYIKFFDADDLMNPGHLEAQLSRLEGNTGSIASCAWGKFSDGNPASAKFIPETVWRDMPPLAWLKAALTQPKDMMGACLWLIPRALIEKAGGWDERLSLNNDFEFSTRLLLQAEQVLFTPDAKIYYRTGLSNSLSKKFNRRSVEAMMLSNELGCSYLLSADNSHEMRGLCANRWQDWVYQVYPQFPDLVEKMEAKIKTLGGSNLEPQGGRIFQVLKPLIGWKEVKRMQKLIYSFGYLKLLKK